MPLPSRALAPVADKGPALVDGTQLQQIIDVLNELPRMVTGSAEIDLTSVIEASVSVSAPTIVATSQCNAALSTTVGTDDNSAGDHAAEFGSMLAWVSDISPGVGFTLNLQCTLGVAPGEWNVNYSYV